MSKNSSTVPCHMCGKEAIGHCLTCVKAVCADHWPDHKLSHRIKLTPMQCVVCGNNPEGQCPSCPAPICYGKVCTGLCHKVPGLSEPERQEFCKESCQKSCMEVHAHKNHITNPRQRRQTPRQAAYMPPLQKKKSQAS